MTSRLPRLAGLALLLVGAAGISLFVGAANLAPADVWRGLSGDPERSAAATLVRDVRLPRVILAALVGAALSVSGALLQAFFQNPMAGPYTVGVSAGAGLLAVIATVAGLSWQLGPVDTRALSAFVGGVAAVALVYGVARKIQYLRSEGLLLVGVAVGSVFSAATSLVLVMSRDAAPSALFWMLGSFANARWSSVATMSLVVLLSGLHSLFLSRDLNALLWGDDVASSLGTPVRSVQVWILLHSSLLAAASVAACGVIGFVGLMVPHIARGWLRTADHRYVLVGSALAGAALVLLADNVARIAMAPRELPVGAITSIFGAPFLVWLVARRHKRFGG